MSIKTQLTKARFLGNGEAREWPLPFPVIAPEHIRVIETDIATGNDTPRTENYEITGCGTDGARVTFPVEGAPLAVGKRLTIYRELPYVQEMDVENGTAFDAEVVESQFDAIVMQIQQLAEKTDRSLQVPITSGQTGDDLLGEIYGARDDARAEAAKSAGWAEAAKGSAALADEARDAAGKHAALAEEARDVAIEQMEANNLLMETELHKVNVIVADNREKQQAVMENARKWAEALEPVHMDEDGTHHYSARYWAGRAANVLPLPVNDDAGKVLTVLPDASLAWQALPPWGIVGDIQLKPFRPEDLAEYCPGWHFCNGDRYPLASPVGATLNALPATFKTDWGVVVSGSNISIPNMFYSDGRGYFLRAVNGTTRRVGNAETDTLQNITAQIAGDGSSAMGFISTASAPRGAFQIGPSTSYFGLGANPNRTGAVLMFDASLIARTSTETRSLNIGMAPAIFLGV